VRRSDKRVLLVEDDRDVREGIAEVLEDEGYLVALANNGLQAVEQLRKTEALPSLILLDLMMPVMDGWQFRMEQKRNPVWASIPVVVLSADGDTLEKSRSIGAVACLRKPLDIYELLDLVEELCKQKSPAEQES
jgi:CheY-like chemotaxis protein